MHIIKRCLRMVGQIEPVTLTFIGILSILELLVRLDTISADLSSTAVFQVLGSKTHTEFFYASAGMFILGLFFEGCGAISGKVAALLSGALTGIIASYYVPGFHNGTPIYLGLIGFTVTGRSLFRNAVDLRFFLGFVSLLFPILITPGLNLERSVPAFFGLTGGLLLEGINSFFPLFDRPSHSILPREIHIEPDGDFQIVHISDLHEDWAGQGWAKFKEVLRNNIKPNLVIATGDLVNTPTRSSILAAANELKKLGEQLEIPVIALPGNHDCSFSGSFLTVPGAKELFSATFQTNIRNSRALILSFESNVNPWLATARINDSAIQAAEAGFGNIDFSPAALRIAMLHHHVLPLPYAADKGFLNQDVFLILRNSSTFLAAMARCDVDLILHGHRHKASFLQFSNRVNFRERVLNILSAGSSTLKGQEGGANFNVIRVHPNCLVSVDRYFYPPGREEPHVDGPYELFSYGEQKHRFFRRYQTAQGTDAESETREVDIGRFGTIDYIRRIQGLKRSSRQNNKLRVNFSSEQGTSRFPTAKWLMPDRTKDEVTISDVDGDTGLYELSLPKSVYTNIGADIEIHFRRDFGFSRTEAEAARLGSSEPHKQVFSAIIRFPIKRLTVHLNRAPEFSDTAVRLRIYYHPSVIAGPLDSAGELPDPGMSPKVRDEYAEQLEHESFNEKTNELRIDYPLVGYIYSLEWDTAKTYDPDVDNISRLTAAKCKDLLRTATGSDSVKKQLQTTIDDFRGEFFTSLSESLFMELYVPDPNEQFILKCIAFMNSGDEGYPNEWESRPIKPGRGIVGAAFKLGEATRFVQGTPEESYYIKLPGSPTYAVGIAVPIYHEEARAAALRGRNSIFQEVGPVMIAFVGSTEPASYLRYFGLDVIPQGKTQEEDAKRKSVTDWILKRLS